MKTFQSRQDGRRRMIWTIPLALTMVVGTATVAVSALKTVIPNDRQASTTSMTSGGGHGSSTASLATAALRDFLADTRNQQAAQPVQLAAAAPINTRSGPSADAAAAQVIRYSSPDAPLLSTERDIDPVRPSLRPATLSNTTEEGGGVQERLKRLWSAGIFR